MKLNNKGFAISSILYIILVMAVILVSLTLTILTSRKLIIEKTKEETLNKIYNRYELTYREVLKTLKEEIISYAIDNDITKESIKIGDFSTSISEEIINGYKLDTKYLTVISNNSNYDVYLGKKETITGNNKEVKDLVDIVDYKIEGNSYQETYTGKNLFDKDKWVNGTETVFNGVNCLLIKDNDSYSYTIPGDSSTQYMFTYKIYRDEENESKITNLKIADRKTVANISHNTLRSVVVYGGETIQFGGWNTNLYLDLSVTQIEKGTEATEYEPYVGGKSSPNPQYPQEVLSVGDKITDDTSVNYGKYNIPIRTGSKNLLDNTSLIASDTSHAKWEITETGFKQIKTSTGGYVATTIYDITDIVRPNTKYYFHRDVDRNYVPTNSTQKSNSGALSLHVDGSRIAIMYPTKTDNSVIMPESFESVQIKTWTVVSDEFTENFDINTEYYLEWSNLYMGTEPYTEYTPYVEPQTTNIYLDNPLRKVDIYKDYIDYSDRSIVRGINKYIITGSEGDKSGTPWKYNGGYANEIRSNVLYDFKDIPSSKIAISNYYPCMDNKNITLDHVRIVSDLSTYGYIAINDLNYPGEDYVDSFVSNLQNLYSSGVPVKVLYPVYPDRNTSDISLPKINTSIGTQTISVDTDIEPSNVEFTIIKKIKQL